MIENKIQDKKKRYLNNFIILLKKITKINLYLSIRINFILIMYNVQLLLILKINKT